VSGGLVKGHVPADVMPPERAALGGERIGPPINLVVLKVASACNLNCTYCYVYNAHDQTFRNRPGVLTDDMARAVLRCLKQYCDLRPGHRMSICLHGGEPLLLGKDRLQRLVALIREEMGERLGSLALQSNAVLIDRGWAALLRKLRLSISVSLDGTAAMNDSERVDHLGRGTHARTVAGIRNLLAAGVHVSALCVVHPGESGASAYEYMRSIGLSDFDFLLPDISHDDLQGRFGHLSPTPVADYLIPAAEAWLAEDNPQVGIRFFADVFGRTLGDDGQTDAFGGGPASYVVIETDGSIQANDALRVCDEAIGETGLNVLNDDLDDLPKGRPLARDLIAGTVPRPDACRACPELETCGGGYMPHRYSRANGFNNPSVWCADILKLFSFARAKLDAHAVSAAE
jgi:uncharacterized protein